MKNWNEAGTVHFDASTNAAYRTRQVDFVCLGVSLKCELNIPLTILNSLSSADFDELKAIGARIFPEWCAKQLSQQAVRLTPMSNEELAAAGQDWLKEQFCEELYNRFTLRQAKAGDAVWAVPELMQQVGPKPEDDDKYLVGGVN